MFKIRVIFHIYIKNYILGIKKRHVAGNSNPRSMFHNALNIERASKANILVRKLYLGCYYQAICGLLNFYLDSGLVS